MNLTQRNPFAGSDADRAFIWEMLVARDTDAFLAADWNRVEADFIEEGFVGMSGSSNPDHWRISFPDLASYRDEWLRQAVAFGPGELRGESTSEFLFRSTVLRDIEIAGDRAAAHKKFDGRAERMDGSPIILSWQSLYWLRRDDGRWRITGFLGYLPNPMPGPDAPNPGVRAPEISQRPEAGPYSPVLCATGGTIVAISGQGPLREDGSICGSTIEEQAALALENCQTQLTRAGASFRDVFRTTVYLREIGDWSAFNEVYKRYFAPPYPARTAIQAGLCGGIRVEIDMLAVTG
jgi:enamine deaminase RidA (YjgF/YER057c/UK114 family)